MSGHRDDGEPTAPAGPGGGPFALPAAGLRLAAALFARPLLVLRHGGGWVTGVGRAGLGPATATTLSGLLDDATTGPDHPLPVADAARLRATFGVPESRGPGPGPRPTGAPEGSDPDDGDPDDGDPDDGDPAPAGGADGSPVRGRDVAAAPGAVVLRTPMFELLQYLPVTEQVHDTPVLLVPPLVHRYWLTDLAPGYSLVEHLLERGLQVFTLSWRPAGPADAGRDLDAHVAAVVDGSEACRRITRAPRISLLGVRTGGLLTAAVQAHQAAIGLDDRVAAAGYLATVLAPAGTPAGPRADPAALRAAAGRAARDGVLDGPSALAAWTPRTGTERVLPWASGGGDGTDGTEAHRPAARALRAWAADLLPLPAGLHTDLVELAAARRPGTGIRVLGTPVDPAALRRDSYLVAAADEPGVPWTAGHRTAAMFDGACRVVLAPGDAAGGLVAPPRAATSYRVGTCAAGGPGPEGTADAEAWLAAADRVDGSWWDDLAGWLTARSGALRDAPPELGGRRLPPLFPAPGTYVTAGQAGPRTEPAIG